MVNDILGSNACLAQASDDDEIHACLFVCTLVGLSQTPRSRPPNPFVMNLPEKTAVVIGAAGFPGELLLPVGCKGDEMEPSGDGGFECLHHNVKVHWAGAVLVRRVLDWRALVSFAGGFSRAGVYFRDFLRIPA